MLQKTSSFVLRYQPLIRLSTDTVRWEISGPLFAERRLKALPSLKFGLKMWPRGPKSNCTQVFECFQAPFCTEWGTRGRHQLELLSSIVTFIQVSFCWSKSLKRTLLSKSVKLFIPNYLNTTTVCKCA